MKKVLSLFLSVLMLISVASAVDLSAVAATNNTSSTATSCYESLNKAIKQVRNYLETRTTSFTVKYRVPKKTSDMEWNYIYESALEETGVPTQGDYLRHNIDSCSGSHSYSPTGNGSEYNVTANYSVSYFTTASQEKKVTFAVEDIIKGFGFKSSTSDYDKILTIYDYVCDYVTYDYKNLNDDSYTLKHSAYAALINGTAVCEGYATLLYRLMMECGISCRVIVSTPNSDNIAHAWNIVKLGTRYYNVDATWEADEGKYPYEYFLKCNSTFNKIESHQRESEYKSSTFNEIYPMAKSDHTDSTDDSVEKKHNYSTVKTLTSATCVHSGLKVVECSHSGCYERYTKKISAKHSWKVTTKADAANKKNGKLKCSLCGTTKKMYYPKKFSVTKSYTYNGKAKKPSVTVKDSKGNKISSKYYTVSYIDQSTGKTVKSIKNPGKYYVKVKMKSSSRYKSYTFKKKTITVKPKKTSIKSVIASRRGFTVKWSKVSTQNTGYQVQYSTSKDFKNPKTVTIKKAGTTSKKVTKLKAKKKYYVRVRTYKTVKVNGKSTKIYSPWSSKKTVTTKG